MSKINAFNLYLAQMPQMESGTLKLGGPLDYLFAIAFEEAKFNKYKCEERAGLMELDKITRLCKTSSLSYVGRSGDKRISHKPPLHSC